jgi:hypothetical protein
MAIRSQPLWWAGLVCTVAAIVSAGADMIWHLGFTADPHKWPLFFAVGAVIFYDGAYE